MHVHVCADSPYDYILSSINNGSVFLTVAIHEWPYENLARSTLTAVDMYNSELKLLIG